MYTNTYTRTHSIVKVRVRRRLYLQDNQIAEVGRGAFAAVTRIGTVDLARNNITKVDFQMFQQVKYAEVRPRRNLIDLPIIKIIKTIIVLSRCIVIGRRR